MTAGFFNQNLPVKPLIKWAGGKSRLMVQFLFLLPAGVNFLVEPFFGSGAVFFHLNPSGAIISDKNEELINFYRVVRDHPEDLLADLTGHVNTEEYYYQIRSQNPVQMTSLKRASRFLYLNKYGYNGLWRVNSKGIHNVPYGRYKTKQLANAQNLLRASARLKRTRILCGDFSLALEQTEPGMFVYLDPPYHPLSNTARFTSYVAGSFGEGEQRRLARAFQTLDQRGCKVMLSNSNTSFIRELYRGYNIVEVEARRAINCKADGRGLITELAIRNYQ